MKEEKKMWCSWCGTLMRGHDTCPRGTGCAKEEDNHLMLMKLISEVSPQWRVKA